MVETKGALTGGEKDFSPTELSRRLWPFFTTLVLSAFGLNWLWEMTQMSAYNEMAGSTWSEAAVPCALASLGDVAMTLAIYGIGALAAGRLGWGMEGRWNVYAASALLGGVLAAAFEWYSLASGRWSYGGLMPVVPVLGVGLWPLLQLVLLVPASLAVAACCGRGSFRPFQSWRPERTGGGNKAG